MNTASMKLITIFAEHVLKDRLISDLLRLGATGYSAGDVEGVGNRGTPIAWQGPNVRIETIVPPAVADRILAALENDYLRDYAVVVWVGTVEVLRPEKFSGPTPRRTP